MTERTSKITVVTEPDYFYTKKIKIALIDLDQKTIELIFNTVTENIVLFIVVSDSDANWALNTAMQADYVIMNLEKESLLGGFLLNFDNVSFYNREVKFTNGKFLKDPMDLIFKIISGNEHDETANRKENSNGSNR